MVKESIEKDESYIAYVSTINGDGYIKSEFGQGEFLLFITSDINEAHEFYTKEEAVELLKEESFEYSKINFFIKEETKITRFIELD